MSEAPERIWADMDGCWWDKPYGESPEYVRCDMLQEIFARYSRVEADRIEELEAKLAKANDHIEGLEELLWAAEKDASEAEAYAGELEAKLAKAVKLIELAIELGRWELNPSFRDELIAFTAELKGQDDE